MEKPKKFLGNCMTNMHATHLEFLGNFDRDLWGKKEEPKFFFNNCMTNMHVPHPTFQDIFYRELWGKKEEPKRFLDNSIDNVPDLEFLDKAGGDLFLKKQENIEKDFEDLEMINEGASVTQLNVNDIILDKNNPSSFENRDIVSNTIIDTGYQTIQPIEPLPRKKLIFGLIKPGRKKRKNLIIIITLWHIPNIDMMILL